MSDSPQLPITRKQLHLPFQILGEKEGEEYRLGGRVLLTQHETLVCRDEVSVGIAEGEQTVVDAFQLIY